MRYRTSKILEAMNAKHPNAAALSAARRLQQNPRPSFLAAAEEFGGPLFDIADAFGVYWLATETREQFVERVAVCLVEEAQRLNIPMEDV